MLAAVLVATTVAAFTASLHQGPQNFAPGGAAISYRVRVTSANLMGVTVTNYGFVGNNFVNRTPSMEYPIGTGYEHLVNGGLWIGARGVDGLGAFTGVTTACLDISQGTSSSQASEYTPAGDDFAIRSSDPTSPFYHPAAISLQDLISEYDDLTPRRVTSNPEDHRPLGLLVRQENYMWSGGRLSHLLIFRFVIKTTGSTLTDLRVGLQTELASGPKNLYSTWPPSASGGPGSWYRKAWLQYDEPLALLREHYCAALPVPDGCNLAFVPDWVGVKLLTPPSAALGQAVTLAAWEWNPIETARDEDVERYAVMGAGTIADLTLPDLMPQTGDPVELLSVGPFGSLAPGDSLVVGFALVGGMDVEDIQENARVAQSAWDIAFAEPPTGVEIPPVPADARLALRGWIPNPSSGARARVELSLMSDAPARLELLDVGGRRVHVRDLDGLGPGRHEVALETRRALGSGVYFLRLMQDGRTVTRRVAVVR